MAAPNIVNVSSIIARTSATSSLQSGSLTAILTNTAASNHVYKINSVTVANRSLTLNVPIDLTIQSASTDYYLAKSVVVPASSSVILVGKENAVYLEEGVSIRGLAYSTGSLDVVIGYEDLS